MLEQELVLLVLSLLPDSLVGRRSRLVALRVLLELLSGLARLAPSQLARLCGCGHCDSTRGGGCCRCRCGGCSCCRTVEGCGRLESALRGGRCCLLAYRAAGRCPEAYLLRRRAQVRGGRQSVRYEPIDESARRGGRDAGALLAAGSANRLLGLWRLLGPEERSRCALLGLVGGRAELVVGRDGKVERVRPTCWRRTYRKLELAREQVLARLSVEVLASRALKLARRVVLEVLVVVDDEIRATCSARLVAEAVLLARIKACGSLERLDQVAGLCSAVLRWGRNRFLDKVTCSSRILLLLLLGRAAELIRRRESLARLRLLVLWLLFVSHNLVVVEARLDRVEHLLTAQLGH